jgi:hypothetical protein
MQVLNLLDDKVLQANNIELGEPTGFGGAHGEVFELVGLPDRVIKLSVLYDTFNYRETFQNAFLDIEMTFAKLIVASPSHFVRVFDFSKLAIGRRKVVFGPQEYIVYGTTMEKLFPLTEGEKKILKTICSLYNKDVDDRRPVEKIVSEVAQWYDFPVDKVLTFYSQLLSCPHIHNDCHRRNIMKDSNNNYKLIDLDLVKIGDYK